MADLMAQRITSRQNPLLQHLVRLQSSAGERRRCGELVGDGWKLLGEAARYGELVAVVAAEGQRLPDLPSTVRVAEVPAALLETISQMETPQGVLFIARRPQETAGGIQPGSLILDGVQDPGNVGTILRAAEAFGAPLVALTEGCADPFGPKALRASMGSAFRQQVQTVPRQEIAARCHAAGLQLVVTALSDTARPLDAVSLQRAAVVIGSEGRGVSPTLLRAADTHMIIPMEGAVESLNAAAAATVVLWELRRGR